MPWSRTKCCRVRGAFGAARLSVPPKAGPELRYAPFKFSIYNNFLSLSRQNPNPAQDEKSLGTQRYLLIGPTLQPYVAEIVFLPDGDFAG